MSRRFRACALMAVACVTACGDAARHDDRTSSARPRDSAVVTTPPAVETPPNTPASSSATAQGWVVTARGIGSLEAGMSPAQAKAVLGPALANGKDRSWSDCDYVNVSTLPEGVAVMVEGGTIARVEVRSGPTATAEGARIGDTEARVKQLYPNRVAVQPHKYTTGHYLIVRPVAPADSNFRVVFETDGRVVTAYRSGLLGPVQYVEGCS